ncbi:MAG: threonine--tRNA ligase, partial [Phycisphaeraceae bacterium]
APLAVYLASEASWYVTGEPPEAADSPYPVPQGDGHGHWEDLCMGPHLPSTGHIGAFKVMSVAQSHWHGDVASDAFQRVYGTSFFTEPDLEAHLERLEEARQRDHRTLGQKLGLFTIDEQVGQGLILWKPKGAMVRSLLQEFLQSELLKRGYDVVYTPHIGKIDLYKTSGHFPYYQDSQFPPIQMRDSEEQYLLRPMNCPHHIKIYASDKHSYRDLPVRLAEFGTVYRFEQSGELTGMTRVRGFTQDDAHIFCTQDQLKGEFRATIELIQFVFGTFGFPEVNIRLSLRDPDSTKYSGEPAVWDRAERELREVLEEMAVPFTEAAGEAAFYGPKVDFIVKDVIGRSWQLGTVQLDYNLPERFQITYVGADNAEHRPVMIHRAPFGSMERFMAILIEHYNGAFPLWLAPEQMRVLPISDKFLDYASKVHQRLAAAGFRAKLDDSNDRLNAKIKVAQDEKVPYMLVVGGRDEAAGTVSVRHRHRGDLGATDLEAFAREAQEEIATRGETEVGQGG